MADNKQEIKVAELFAGVGGFRVGLQAASDAYVTVWSNQWEPATKRQDASIVYRAHFGEEGHCNRDINTVPTADIPDCDMLVGGFPCQDYSVATTLSNSGGIEGKKGVLWWQIYRILKEKGEARPRYLFFENVDRLLNSPARQRGRDFAIILATLSDLGYAVEWRIINAADYGMPQRRRRTYIVGYRTDTAIAHGTANAREWVLHSGVMATAFPHTPKAGTARSFSIVGDVAEVSATFNKGRATSPFCKAGIIAARQVYTVDTEPCYDGTHTTLGDILVSEQNVPKEFFISDDMLPRWQYEKDAKKIKRTTKEGHEYIYSEGSMAFPDCPDRPSRTIITGEGGASPSRFKHVVRTASNRYRRLVPVELERLNMFPDNHTAVAGVSDTRRAFLMGNALVCGVVCEIGRSLVSLLSDNRAITQSPGKQLHEVQLTFNFEAAECLVEP